MSEPTIWLDEYEAEGKMVCGCQLDSMGPNDEPGASFYQCLLHASAGELLEALTLLLIAVRADDQDVFLIAAITKAQKAINAAKEKPHD